MITYSICSVCKKTDNPYAISPSTGLPVKICQPCWDKHYAHQVKPAEHHKKKKRIDRAKKKIKGINRNRQYLRELLSNAKCMDCGYDNWIALELDHRDPSEKLDAVTRILNNGVALERVKAEAAKCDIVCANCHAIRTAKRANSWRLNLLEK